MDQRKAPPILSTEIDLATKLLAFLWNLGRFNLTGLGDHDADHW